MSLHLLSLHVSSYNFFPTFNLLLPTFQQNNQILTGAILGKRRIRFVQMKLNTCRNLQNKLQWLLFYPQKMFKIRNVKISKVGIKHQSINLYLTWTVNVTCGFIFLYTPVNEYSRGFRG